MEFERLPFSDDWSSFRRRSDGYRAYATELTETRPEGYAVMITAPERTTELEGITETLRIRLALPGAFVRA